MGWSTVARWRGIIVPMAAEPTEIRMARLEGAYEQINERLGALEQRLSGEIAALRTDLRSEVGGLRQQMNTQFYWLLTFILGSILIPILRDLVH